MKSSSLIRSSCVDFVHVPKHNRKHESMRLDHEHILISVVKKNHNITVCQTLWNCYQLCTSVVINAAQVEYPIINEYCPVKLFGVIVWFPLAPIQLSYLDQSRLDYIIGIRNQSWPQDHQARLDQFFLQRKDGLWEVREEGEAGKGE